MKIKITILVPWLVFLLGAGVAQAQSDAALKINSVTCISDFYGSNGVLVSIIVDGQLFVPADSAVFDYVVKDNQQKVFHSGFAFIPDGVSAGDKFDKDTNSLLTLTTAKYKEALANGDYFAVSVTAIGTYSGYSLGPISGTTSGTCTLKPNPYRYEGLAPQG